MAEIIKALKIRDNFKNDFIRSTNYNINSIHIERKKTILDELQMEHWIMNLKSDFMLRETDVKNMSIGNFSNINYNSNNNNNNNSDIDSDSDNGSDISQLTFIDHTEINENVINSSATVTVISQNNDDNDSIDSIESSETKTFQSMSITKYNLRCLFNDDNDSTKSGWTSNNDTNNNNDIDYAYDKNACNYSDNGSNHVRNSFVITNNDELLPLLTPFPVPTKIEYEYYNICQKNNNESFNDINFDINTLVGHDLFNNDILNSFFNTNH